MEKYWKYFQYWTDVIQSHMRTVRDKSKPFEWAKGKPRERPCDAALVYALDRSHTEQTNLASVASALRVEEIPDDICLVVAMNADDCQVSREPDEWYRRFVKRNIHNLCFGGWGETKIDWYYEWDRWVVLKIADFVTIWTGVVNQFNERVVWYRALRPESLRYSALVHWYGGVNRSGTAVVCLVMAMEQVSLQEALDKSLLKHHSGIVVLSTCICSNSCFQAHERLEVFAGGLRSQMSLGGHCDWSPQSATSVCYLSGGIGDTCLSLTPLGDLH